MRILTRGREKDRVRDRGGMPEADGAMGTTSQGMQAVHPLEAGKGKETNSSFDLPEKMSHFKLLTSRTRS